MRNNLINREQYMKRIRPFIESDLIKVLTGMRRSGKSVMLELIKKELILRGVSKDKIISINFESLNYYDLCNAFSLHEKIQKCINDSKEKYYLFFDEIQEVKDWEKAINSFRVEFNCDIYVTGSNAKLLSSELATYLAGRYVEFIIYPFSYAEFLTLYKLENPLSEEELIFSTYLTLGGMPYLSNLRYKEEPSYQYLLDLFNSVILKDVVKRNNIRDVDLLERIITYVLANIGNTFSATSISKYFKNEKRIVAPETILNYLKACEEAFLFYKVKRQDIKGKQLLSVNEKYYVSDLGIREAVLRGNLKDINLSLENIVYMELLRRGYSVTVGKLGDKEIDFIATRQEEKIYLQVTYLLSSEETIKREFGIYDGVKDNYPKFVISLDKFNMSQNGIKHYNLKKFLLMESWN